MLSFGYNNMLNMNNFNCGNTFNMGGYGNFNSFGSFGTSLFGLGNFGYSNFGCNTDFGCGSNGWANGLLYMLGSVTPALLTLGIGAAGNAIADAKDNKAGSLVEQAADYNKDIDKAIENLCEGLDRTNYKNHKATEETWYVEGKAEIDDTKTTQKAIVDKLESAYEADKATVANYRTAKVALEAKKTEAGADTTAIDRQLATLKTNFDIANKNVKKYEEAKAAYDEAVEEEKALEAKAKTRQEAINKQIEKITNMIETQANLQKAAETKAVKKADGNSITRLKDEEYNALFDAEGKVKADAKVDKHALNKAFSNYSKETNTEKKEKIKNQIKDLWAKLPYDEKTTTLRNAYAAMFPEG